MSKSALCDGVGAGPGNLSAEYGIVFAFLKCFYQPSNASCTTGQGVIDREEHVVSLGHFYAPLAGLSVTFPGDSFHAVTLGIAATIEQYQAFDIAVLLSQRL